MSAITGMVHGGRAFGVPMGRTAGAAKRGRGRAVIVYNPKGVTHLFRTRTNSARTHALHTHAPSHVHATRALHELHAACSGTHCTARFSLLVLSFLLLRYANALAFPLSV